MHIIIIGAGVVGLTSAYELLQHGHEVEIFDQQLAGTAASWAGGGILSPMYPWKYPTAVNQLAKYGKDSYTAMNQHIQSITGIDFEIQTTGMMIFDHDQFDAALHYAEYYHEPQQQAVLLDQQQIRAINPQVNCQLSQAVYFPQQANIRNPRVVKSLIAYIQQHKSATLHQHTPIVDFEQSAHHIHAVRDAQGQIYRADQYIIAAGAWSEQLLAKFSLGLDIQPIHGQMVLYKAPKDWLPTMCMNNTMYLIPRRDGHIVCGSSTNSFGFDRTVHQNISDDIIHAALTLVPQLSQFEIVKQWSGLRPGSPTGIPKICRLSNYDNIWCNVGHYRNGLVTAPASARLLRQQLHGEPTFIDASPYQF